MRKPTLRFAPIVLSLILLFAVVSRADAARKIEVRESGLVANLWIPEGEGPFPGLLLLGGSGGGVGWQDEIGELLAGRGFIALALAYFGLDSLPEELERIPLEYVDHSLTYLRLHPQVDTERIGVVGVSKGGELALLVASMRPEIHAVVTFVPSGFVWQSVADGFPLTSSWSYRGAEVPYVAYGSVDNPSSIADFYRAGIEQAEPDALTAATIPVERIGGPILLLSGRADNLWPSTDLSERIVARLDKQHFGYPVEHQAYPDAGHLLSRVRDDDVTRRGGTAEGNRRAQLDGRDRMIAFLERHLKPSPGAATEPPPAERR